MSLNLFNPMLQAADVKSLFTWPAGKPVFCVDAMRITAFHDDTKCLGEILRCIWPVCAGEVNKMRNADWLGVFG